jgi:hypothetical protein
MTLSIPETFFGWYLDMNRKSGLVSKLISKKKNEMTLKKMSYECMLLLLKIQLFIILPTSVCVFISLPKRRKKYIYVTSIDTL